MRVSRLVAAAAGLLLTGFASSGDAQSIRQESSGALSYEAFIKLPQPERAAAYAKLSIDDKGAIIREHIGAWIKEHRASLSEEQIKPLEGMAALLAPGSDREQTGDEYSRLTQELECRLWRSDFYAALAPHREPPSGGFFGDVMFWLHECVTHR